MTSRAILNGWPLAAGGFASFAASPPLARYPNFPQVALMQPRAMSDVITSGAGSFSMVDMPDFTDGRKMVQFTTGSGSGQVRSPLRAPLDVRNGHISIWLKMLSFVQGDVSAMQIRLYSTGTPGGAEPANYHSWGGRFDIVQQFSQGPATKVGAHPNDFTAVGTGADLSAITWVSFHGQAQSGKTVTFYLSDIQFVPNPRTKAAVIFRMDDAWIYAYSILKPLLDAKGVPMFLAPGAVSGANGFNGAGVNTPPTTNPDRMSISQVNEMRSLGTQCGTQSWTTEANLADYAAYLTEFQGMQRYFADRAWLADAADGTYYTNVGQGTQGARQAMLKTGSRTIQRFVNGRNGNAKPLAMSENFPFTDETAITALNVAGPGIPTGGTITDAITIELNRVIATKGVLIIAGHNDMATDPNQLAAVQYVLNRYASGGGAEFDITTMAKLLEPYRTIYGERDYAAPNW